MGNDPKQKKRVRYRPVTPRMQLGFVHNTRDCIGCRTCEIACKDKNGLEAGPRFRRVSHFEGGSFPEVFAYFVNISCNHCRFPACVPVCPTGAIWKRKKDGIVDIDSTMCIGCRRCEAACPYGAPQFDNNEGIIKKCNLCVDEIDAGRKPYCVAGCIMRVLDSGPIDRLRSGKFSTKAFVKGEPLTDRVKGFADPSMTVPSMVFIPHSKGKESGN